MGKGKGPPFYMDMRHLDENEVRHLQYELMPGDKATYLDYCNQKGIEFSRDLLEVEISELSFSGGLMMQDNFETNVSGLYNACVFFAFSGAICGGYYAGTQAAEAVAQPDEREPLDESELLKEKARIYKPLKTKNGMSYREFEGAIRQVMAYYMGYRRNQQGMETALEKLSFLEDCVDQLTASNCRELMKANESRDLVKLCRLSTRASLERKGERTCLLQAIRLSRAGAGLEQTACAVAGRGTAKACVGNLRPSFIENDGNGCIGTSNERSQRGCPLDSAKNSAGRSSLEVRWIFRREHLRVRRIVLQEIRSRRSIP